MNGLFVVNQATAKKRLALALLVSAFAVGSALAAPSCASKAVDKNGKTLAGAAKASYVKKCMSGG